MTKKVKFILVFTIILCVMFGTVVFGVQGIEPISTEVNGAQTIDEPEPYVPDAPPPLDLPDEILPITDDMLSGNLNDNAEDEESYDGDESNNVWFFVVGAIGIVVLVGIVAFVMKKK